MDEENLEHPKLTALGGSQADDWNNALIDQTLNSLWLTKDEEERLKQFSAVAWGLKGIAPKGEIEAMIAGQLIASHNAAMECYRRAMGPEQSFEGREDDFDYAGKLSRTHAALLEALDRIDGKGHQTVTVEHVHVHPGAQAVVGVVAPAVRPGGGNS